MLSITKLALGLLVVAATSAVGDACGAYYWTACSKSQATCTSGYSPTGESFHTATYDSDGNKRGACILAKQDHWKCCKPTPAPTGYPTTRNPTGYPTGYPTTSSPTPGPTSLPTPGPTASPTPAPTPAPTPSPTPGPTSSPTPGPTASPTPAPSGQMDRLNGECQEDYFTRVASDDFKAKAAAKPLLKAEAKQLIVKAKDLFKGLKSLYRNAKKTLRGIKRSAPESTPLQTANPTPLQTANPTPLQTANPTPLQADAPFGGILGSKNGAPAGMYTFQLVRASSTSATNGYTDIMKAECTKVGMKPVCEHPTYCKSDTAVLYIGQDNHIAHPAHRGTDQYFPSGWSTLKDKFPSIICTYTGSYGQYGHFKTLCTTGSSFAWQTPAENGDILCGKVVMV